MEETLARIFVLMMLVQLVAALVIGSGPVFWLATMGELVAFATWAAWMYVHRNDLPEEEE